MADDNLLPVVAIFSGGQSVEGNYATFTIQLSDAAADAVTMTYRVISGAAGASKDVNTSAYANNTGTVTFAAGESTKTLQFYIQYDSLDELDEDFTVELANVQGAIFPDGYRTMRATGWALDDDGAGLNRAMAVSAPVVSENVGKAVFTVSLSEAFTTDRSFSFSTFDGSGLAGSDYVAKSGTVTFLAGQTEATVEIDVTNDGTAEPGETFGLKITGAHGVNGATGTAQILDNDGALPVLSLEGSGAEEGSYTQFILRLSKPATDAVTMNYRIVGGTAELGADVSDSAYGNNTGIVSFAPGEDTKVLQIYAQYDNIDEIDENFALEISNINGASFGGGNQSLRSGGWVLDDDGVGLNRALSVTAPVVTEGAGKAVFTVSLSEAFTTDRSFTFSTFDGSATAGSDYAARTGTITFAAGQTEASVAVDILADRLVEAGETFGLKIAGAHSLNGATGTAQILDDDGAVPVVSVEGSGALEGRYATYTIRLSKPAADAVSMSYALQSGTAIVREDTGVNAYGDSTGTVSFAAGETTKTLSFYVNYDTLDEIDESFALELANLQGATFAGGNRALRTGGWALDDDGLGNNRALSVTAPVVNESTGKAVFAVSLSEAFTTDRSFTFSTFDGSARAGSDYKAATGTVTFAAGQTEASVAVDLLNDNVAEAGESFGLKVDGANGVAGAAGTAQILDTDSAEPVVSFEGGRSVEGNYATFTIRLSKPATDAVTMNYATISGSALVGTDFSSTAYANYTGSVSFAPGEDTKKLEIYVSYDSLDEIDENFAVELSNLQGATFGGGNRTLRALGWSLDDDGAGVNRSIAVSGATVVEQTAAGASTAVFVVELSQASETPLTVTYATRDGTAKAGRDYVAGSGSITFAAGQTRAEVPIRIIADVEREGTESFTLTVSPPYPAAISGQTVAQSAAVNIVDATIRGGSGNETLRGTIHADRMEGGAGNDRMFGFAGGDLMYGDAGNDLLDGGAGGDRMVGGAGNDMYFVDNKADRVEEEAKGGTDLVSSAISYTLTANVENLLLGGKANLNGYGNSLSNTLTGNDGKNKLEGAGGHDKLYGGKHADSLFGGSGNDLLDGGSGADRLVGGTGNDSYVIDNKGDKVEEARNAGTDLVRSSISYTLGANVENLALTGKAGLNGYGNSLANTLTGNDGKNTLKAYGGHDKLYGGKGDDRLEGGSGNDRLEGGAGADDLVGGSGRDTFVFARSHVGLGSAARDWILDFTRGQDKIDLTPIDADTTRGGTQEFDFIGSGRFSREAGELRFANQILSADLNGDGKADFEIGVDNLTRLTLDDFIL